MQKSATGQHTAPPCRFFIQGRCNAGRTCRFSHDPKYFQQQDALGKAPCKFFQNGICVAGDACPYGHFIVKKKKPAASKPAPVAYIPKPTDGYAVHAKASLRSDEVEGSAVYRNTLGDAEDDLTYETESFLIGITDDDQANAYEADSSPQEGFSYAAFARRGLNEAEIDASAIVAGSQDLLSEDDLAKRRLLREQIMASTSKECGICMETVVGKQSQFGLLEGCDHIFCLSCIREWRSVNILEKSVKRSCPLCRCVSFYVIPSSFFPRNQEEKDAVVASYRDRLQKIPCRHFNYGAGECPFGTR
eukprot:36667-Hanusia_phi.AAC.3